MYEEKHHPNGFVFKPKLKPSAAGSIWRGGARKRADGDFLHKKSSEQSELCSDVVREAGVEPALKIPKRLCRNGLRGVDSIYVAFRVTQVSV